jgi:hypothetical protein
MEKYVQAQLLSGKRVAFKQAEEMEVWMKEHAPWTDRTKKARQGLRAYVDESAGVGPIGSIIITHDTTLFYTFFLETISFGRWSIILPTLDYWEPRLQKSLERISRLGHITIVT